MSEKEAFDRAVKDDHFDLLVSFDRGDGLVELRNRVRAKDVERRMINRYAPVLGRPPREMYLFSHDRVIRWLLLSSQRSDLNAARSDCRFQPLLPTPLVLQQSLQSRRG